MPAFPSSVMALPAECFVSSPTVRQATCKRFGEYCAQHGVPLNPPAPPYSGFVLSYDSIIPRQTGLSGSSAIINSGGAGRGGRQAKLCAVVLDCCEHATLRRSMYQSHQAVKVSK